MPRCPEERPHQVGIELPELCFYVGVGAAITWVEAGHLETYLRHQELYRAERCKLPLSPEHVAAILLVKSVFPGARIEDPCIEFRRPPTTPQATSRLLGRVG